MTNDFAAFIITHGRPDNVVTLQSLRTAGYTGKVFFVVDDEDKTLPRYIQNFGSENVLIFNKAEIAKTFDEMDNFGDRRSIVYGRNACFPLARSIGIRYFIQLDDDYTTFRYAINSSGKYITSNTATGKLDKLFSIILDFYKITPFATIAFAQGGDFIGGEGCGIIKRFYKNEISRKAMNSFFCSTGREFHFIGRINEDVNTYTACANRGLLMMTIPNLRLEQKQTQSNAGGMTDLYKAAGTYVKSFYTIMAQPSSTKIKMMGYVSPRLHHNVNWETTVPKILPQKIKK